MARPMSLTVNYEAFCLMMLARIQQVVEQEEEDAIERLDEIQRIMNDIAGLTGPD